MSSLLRFFARSIRAVTIVAILSSSVPARQSTPVQGEVMISHVSPEYSGPGDEFIVLFNATDHSIDMEGFEVKYITAGGSTGPAGRIFTTASVIAPRCYLLLATRDTVQAGTVQVIRDGTMATGMSATGGQLVIRETAAPTNILYALAWGTVTVYVAGMTDAAVWPGDGILRLSPNGNTYDRSFFNSPNSAYSHQAAGSITEIPTSATAPLPVELISFVAEAKYRTVELLWKTATETDNSGWDIERRSVSKEYGVGTTENAVGAWKSVGFVEGAGTSTSPRSYSCSEAIPQSTFPNVTPSGVEGPQFRYAYRLKQLDRSGTFSYSLETEVEIGLAPKEFVLGEAYPNPFNPETTLEFTLAEADRAVLRVYDVLGREAATLFDGIADAGRIYRQTFDASHISTGLYFVRFESGGKAAVRKLVYLR